MKLRERGSARLERIGRRFTRKFVALVARNPEARRDFGRGNLCFKRQREDDESVHGRLQPNGQILGVVGRRVWQVMAFLVVVAAMMVLMKDEMRHRSQELAGVCLGCQMNRDVVQMKGEEDRHAGRGPPTRTGWQAAHTSWAASVHRRQGAK